MTFTILPYLFPFPPRIPNFVSNDEQLIVVHLLTTIVILTELHVFNLYNIFKIIIYFVFLVQKQEH